MKSQHLTMVAILLAAGVSLKLSSLSPIQTSVKDGKRHNASLLASSSAAASASAVKPDRAAQGEIFKGYGKLPLTFEANQGQTDSRVKYMSRGPGYTLFLTGQEAVVKLKRTKEDHATVVTMKFADRDPKSITAENLQEGKTNYYIGNDKSKWLTNVANYAQVRYTEVFPGIDAVFYGQGERMRYDLVVRKGGNANEIALQFAGANNLKIDDQGDLVLETDTGDVVFERPYVYQEIAGTKQEVQSGYRLQEDGTVAFDLGRYDPNQTLVIDPVLNFSTYLGGTQADVVTGVKVIPSDGVYVSGTTSSPDFPISTDTGANGTTINSPYAGLKDAFVAKLNLLGTTRLWASYYGGSSDDMGNGLALSTTFKCLVLVGSTTSPNLPASNSAFSPGHDAFAATFVLNTGAFISGVYIGGNNEDFGNAVVIFDSIYPQFTQGYMVGSTTSNDFVNSAGGFQRALSGIQDGFIIRLDFSYPCGFPGPVCGTVTLGTSTYVGGTGVENLNAVDYIFYNVPPAGGYAVLVAGDTTSTNATFPQNPAAPNNLQIDNAGGMDAFVASYDVGLHDRLWSSFIGGSGADSAKAVTSVGGTAVGGRILIAGNTNSLDLPTTAGAQQTRLNGVQNVFVAEIFAFQTPPPMYTYYSYLTYLGGSGIDSATAILGSEWVVGKTTSPNFPTVHPIQAALSGSSDGFLTRVDSLGTQLIFSTYFGGPGNDGVNAIARDGERNILYLGGQTDGSIPTSAGAYRRTPGSEDGFVTSYAFNDLIVSPSAVYDPIAFGGVAKNDTLTLTWTTTVNAFTIGPVIYSGPSVGSACSGWLSLTKTDVNTINARTDPTGAHCPSPATGLIATFSVDGGADNGPQLVTAYLDITGTSSGGPNVTLQPINQTICAGSTVAFTSAAGGSSPTVQWQVSIDSGTTWTNISGATNGTLTFLANATQNNNQYRAIWTNSAGSTISTAASLTVNTAPVVTASPASVSISSGQTAVFTAVATGSPSPTVQWQVSTDNGVTFTSIAGATATTLTTSATTAMNGNRYRAVFSNTCGVATTDAAVLAVVVFTGLQFITVAPCRIMDTRPNGDFSGVFGSPFLAANATRTIPVQSSACGIPSTAAAYSLNVTVVPRVGTLGYLTVWPTGQPQPNASTLNSLDGSVLANATIVPTGTNGSINAFALNDTELVIDINGYFVPPIASSLQFYPVPPCRVLDTRSPVGVLGGPILAAGTSRDFPVLSSSCGIPSTARAYSFNVTVVPSGFLGFLTAYPTGQPNPALQHPGVSTLNSLDGTVLANAAIVPTGANGSVSFYASNPTHLVVDINGYFAAPGLGGLDFHTVSPCRLVDTRSDSNPLFTGAFGPPSMAAQASRTFPLPGVCGLPPTASAYSLNVTVVPFGPLGFLTAWPSGQPQPGASTLNAPKGIVVANAALASAGTNGAVDVFVLNSTQVIIDTNGYFSR